MNGEQVCTSSDGKCTLATSRAVSQRVTLSIQRAPLLRLEKDGKNRRTDRRTPERCIALTSRRDQRNEQRNRCIYRTNIETMQVSL